MQNYNTALQSNNINLQSILDTINELPEADSGEQATPEISVDSSNGLITAIVGTKSSTHQLAFQPAKTITPSTIDQIAVSSGYYTGGDIIVEAVPTQVKSITPTATTQNVTPDSGKFLSKVTVNGDSNLVAGNIKSGVSIFGVSGTYAGSGGSSSGDASAEDDIIMRTISGTYTNDRVTTIGYCAFQSCRNLTAVSFPAATSIGYSAFANCSSLTAVSFPAATSIGNSAFQSCYSLTIVGFPAAKTISSNAFQSCFNLTAVSFPATTTIGYSAFLNCSNLTTASFPVATSIGNSAFMNCRNLTTANFPVATSIGNSAFDDCRNLTTASFPVATSIGNSAFANCSSLTTVSFPAATTIGSYVFANCSSLTTASFPAAKDISSNAFRSCYSLTTVYLTGSSLCRLSNSNAFYSTPIGGYSTYAETYGSIYVPASLLTSYQTATNWTYFSSRFVGI